MDLIIEPEFEIWSCECGNESEIVIRCEEIYCSVCKAELDALKLGKEAVEETIKIMADGGKND